MVKSTGTCLISFVTDRFDPAKETPNDINPIAGEALLLWLREQLREKDHDIGLPESEDWGWYTYAKNDKAKYLLGASGEPTPSEQDICWIVQIHKKRSLIDKLLGRNILHPKDLFVLDVEQLLKNESDFRSVVKNMIAAS